MGIFNNIKSLSDKAIKRADTTFEVVYGDYVKRDELLNYYDKTKPITTSNIIDMGGNRIINLGEPVDDTDGVSKSFLNKRITYATRNLKTDINTSIADLTKTNNDKVVELEAKIIKGATDLSEIQKTITSNIKTITDTLSELNKKDTLTAGEIKNINDKLVNELKNVETKMNDFNKMFIDTEELQSEITKVKNSLITSLTNKDIADTAVVKTDITNVKSSIEDMLKTIKNINIKIAGLSGNVKDLTDKGDRTAALETKINNINTQKTLKDEELKREITELTSSFNSNFGRLNSNIEELERKHTITRQITDFNTKRIEADEEIAKDDNNELNTKITNVETLIGNSIQIINAASKTLNDETNTRFNNIADELNEKIRQTTMDLDYLSTKAPFQLIIASLVATDKADKVEIFGTNISKTNRKDVSYDILSRVAHHENFRSFRPTAVHKFYFDHENDSILIPKVGIRIFKEGTYIIQTKFHINIKKNRNVKYLQLNYKHNETNYPQNYIKPTNKEFIWMDHIRFDFKVDDTLDIKLNAIDIDYEDLFDNFWNSSIEIFYIDYLGLPVVKNLTVN